MIVRLSRLMRQLRRKKSIGLGVLLVVLIGSVVGNALTFFIFDSAQDPSVGDAFWYSVISITTIGYGDFSAESLGARIGTGVSWTDA